MASMSHDRPDDHGRVVPGSREMWASIAIATMWAAVAVDALWGPDIVATTAAGDRTTVPSAIVVALFAWLGTWAVARHALHQPRRD